MVALAFILLAVLLVIFVLALSASSKPMYKVWQLSLATIGVFISIGLIYGFIKYGT